MRNLLLCASMVLFLAIQATSQSRNASLSGTVEDAQGAVIPGVRIMVTNKATGIVSTSITNNVGIYNFPSLLPGVYKVSAEAAGFKTYTYTDVQMGNASQIRLNFNLQVGVKAETVEVSVEADRLLLEASSSVGDALTESEIRELPRVNNNVLDLVKIMPGASVSGDAIFGEAFGYGGGATTFAGVSSANINIQRDGVPVSDVRWATGVNSATRLNPDLVGEFRIILAPVDAEVGRGNGQIQIQTKSGTNDFHGNLSWNIQNSSLDPNTWENKRLGVDPPWRNLNEYTISVGGPIIRNKTFFFVLWNQQFARQRAPVNVLTLTPCARNGVFRYFPNWNNGNAQTVTNAATPVIAVVHADGAPRAPATNPDGSAYAYTQPFAESVFGPLANEAALNADCSNYSIAGSPWDSNRSGPDPTGYISSFMGLMPEVNNYDIGDGLNTAGHRWTRTLRGADNLYGVGEDTNRRQINVRIDHTLSDRHRVAGTWSFEKNWADDNFVNWPQNAYGGRNERQPQVFSINVTSSLTPTFLNEVNVGMMRTGTNVYSPLTNPETGAEMRKLLREVDGSPVIIGPGSGSVIFSPEGGPFGAAGYPSSPYGGRGLVIWDLRDTSPRWTFGDTMNWTKGSHSFKWGGEYRKSSSYGAQGWAYQSFSSYVPIPIAAGGASSFSPVTGIDATNMPGILGDANSGNVSAMQGLLNFLSGSLSGIRQSYYINRANQTTWSDQLEEPLPIRDFNQREFAFFFKDDWKIHPDLTLNLGLRYEYYGVPFMKNGMTAGFDGGGDALYGISGRSWEDAFWQPGARADETRIIFIGPDSSNSNQKPYERDLNNFGPAIGFAWQMPWLGKGKTTVRGGYQLSYLSSGRATDLIGILGNPPGSTYNTNYTGDPDHPYLNLNSLVGKVPVPDDVQPMSPIPLTNRLADISAFDPRIRTPYVQNVTLAITHSLTSKLDVDVRYIGTLSRKLYENFNINAPNFLTNGLLQAFNAVRGPNGDSDLLNTMLHGVDLIGAGNPIDGVSQTAGMHLRGSFASAPQAGLFTPISIALATGDYETLANMLNVMGYPNGQYLRGSGEFPENFIKTNPQFNSASFRTNGGHANYHSFQAQANLRPTHGLSVQATYTWSRNLGLTGEPTNPLNRDADYTLLSSNRSHVFSTYGSLYLPFGPKRAFLGNSSGMLAKWVEGWQLNWIANVSSGIPMSITAGNMLYANGVPDQVGPFDFDSARVHWDKGDEWGNYFGNRYVQAPDPQCAAVAPEIQFFCNNSLKAIADVQTGQIVFQNPQPGTRGTFGRNRLTGPTTWSLDMAVAKSVSVAEGKSISFRLDASNIFNHAQPSLGQTNSGVRIITANLPSVDINSSSNPFGHLNNKVGTRTFQMMLRFDF